MNAIINALAFDANDVIGPNQSQPRAARGAGIVISGIAGGRAHHQLSELTP